MKQLAYSTSSSLYAPTLDEKIKLENSHVGFNAHACKCCKFSAPPFYTIVNPVKWRGYLYCVRF